MTEDERRKTRLTDDQIEAIRDAILASIYEDIGRSIVKRLLWVCGAIVAAAGAYIAAQGYLK